MAQAESPPQGSTLPLVRVVVSYRNGHSERLWGALVRPHLARVISISHWSNLSYGDVVKVSPLCSCGEDHEQYQAGQRVFRGSRRVQSFTRGVSARRVREVVEYLTRWPTVEGYSTHALAVPGWVSTQIMPDGFPAGLAAYATVDRSEGDTHWRLAFPWATRRRVASAFLDACPYIEWHALQPDSEGDR